MTAEHKKNFFIENIRTVVDDMLQKKPNIEQERQDDDTL